MCTHTDCQYSMQYLGMHFVLAAAALCTTLRPLQCAARKLHRVTPCFTIIARWHMFAYALVPCVSTIV